MTPSAIALIPARSGSKRVSQKNIRELNGHPLIAYTITTALNSGLFKDVIVSTDSEVYADIARHYGASVPFLRPAEFAADSSPDIEWIDFTLRALEAQGRTFDAFFLLRPTSPFRVVSTLKRAWNEFLDAKNVDSLRAVQKCTEHPGKMWVVRNGRMFPILPFEINGRPWHSSPYQSLPEVFIQNASLEIAWTSVVVRTQSIAGSSHLPFFTENFEGFDINNADDWSMAERLVANKSIELTNITRPAFFAGRS
jgi:CMP-N,N'-diacetyllegionaminic acid synthase